MLVRVLVRVLVCVLVRVPVRVPVSVPVQGGGQKTALGTRDPAPPPAGNDTKEPILRKSQLSTGSLDRFFL